MAQRRCTICERAILHRTESRQCSRPCREVAMVIREARREGRDIDMAVLAPLLLDCEDLPEWRRKQAEQFMAARIDAETERMQAEWDEEDAKAGVRVGTMRERRRRMMPTQSLIGHYGQYGGKGG
jgi:hypothetical protein